MSSSWTGAGITGVTQLSGGGAHHCAVLDRGTVSCWTVRRWRDNVRVVEALPVAGLRDVVAVTAGDEHDCALESSGAVFCWGRNYEGQLGIGKVSSVEPATRVPGLAALAVAASRNETCAILRGGGIACWGDGQVGGRGYPCDVGDGHQGDCQKRLRGSSTGPVEWQVCTSPVPYEMDKSESVFAPSSLSFGAPTACAKDAKGSVQCWGRILTGGVSCHAVPL